MRLGFVGSIYIHKRLLNIFLVVLAVQSISVPGFSSDCDIFMIFNEVDSLRTQIDYLEMSGESEILIKSLRKELQRLEGQIVGLQRPEQNLPQEAKSQPFQTKQLELRIQKDAERSQNSSPPIHLSMTKIRIEPNVHYVASPDLKSIVGVDQNEKILYTMDLATGHKSTLLYIGTRHIPHIKFSNDGKRIAVHLNHELAPVDRLFYKITGNGMGRLLILEVDTGKQVGTFSLPGNSRVMSFGKNNDEIYTRRCFSYFPCVPKTEKWKIDSNPKGKRSLIVREFAERPKWSEEWILNVGANGIGLMYYETFKPAARGMHLFDFTKEQPVTETPEIKPTLASAISNNGKIWVNSEDLARISVWDLEKNHSFFILPDYATWGIDSKFEILKKIQISADGRIVGLTYGPRTQVPAQSTSPSIQKMVILDVSDQAHIRFLHQTSGGYVSFVSSPQNSDFAIQKPDELLIMRSSEIELQP